MLNPNAKPFVFNKRKTSEYKYNNRPKSYLMIQCYHTPTFFYGPPLHPFSNTISSFTCNRWTKNSDKPPTRKMFQLRCAKLKFDNVVEVKMGPRAFTRSTFGVETKPFRRHVSETIMEKPGCVLKWRPKGSPSDLVELEPQLKGKTTLMIKNIPNKLSKKVLLEYLDKHCCEENEKITTSDSSLSSSCPSEYDFVYLPMDFRSGYNLGYAFVNFTSTVAALNFYKSYNKHKWEFYASAKICEIKLARIQGKEELIRNFRHSRFLCHTDDFLPTVFNPPRKGSPTMDDSDTTSPKAYVVGRRSGRGAFANKSIVSLP